MGEEKAVKELRKQILKEFFKFLKEKKVYTRYKKNIADCVVRERYRYETMEEKRKHWYDAYQNGIYVKILCYGRHRLNYERCRELINYAFCWSDTLERHNFWASLSSEWADIFRENYGTYASVLNEK